MQNKNAGQTDAPNKSRTQVKDLPKPERELTPDERKNVKGGAKQIICSGDRPTDPNA
ncbi:MAG TPA: hypothetical protein VGB73_19385 [Pyrinomonadaceae bacterium]|jgi:hypothetical protein